MKERLSTPNLSLRYYACCRKLSDQFSQGAAGLSDELGHPFPQWWTLLVAILATLSGSHSLVGVERFTKWHRQTLNKLLGTEFGRSPSALTSRLLLAQLDVSGFEILLHVSVAAQPGVAQCCFKALPRFSSWGCQHGVRPAESLLPCARDRLCCNRS